MSGEQVTRTDAGLGGVLRLLAALVVLVLAGLAGLVVLGVMPLDVFNNWAVKLAMLAGIGGVASVLMWVLTSLGRN
jgi:hypothetical protein